jgi:hypothetical protein
VNAQPIDPRSVPLDELRRRVKRFFDSSLVPSDDPVPVDHFRCFVCLRTFRKRVTDADAKAEMRRRFGEVQVKDQYVICDDCNEIISADVGDTP